MKKTLLAIALISTILQSFAIQESFQQIGTTTFSLIKDHPITTAALIGASVTSLAIGAPCFYFRNHTMEERWDWSNIDTTKVEFPKNFIWGVADSAFQVEGIETANGKTIQNTWTAWEAQEIPNSFVDRLRNILGFPAKTHPRTPENERAGFACHRWSHYKEDIQLLKKIGVQAHRFSIEWAKIEPEEGVYDEAALQHYLDYTQELIDNGIMPCPNFFHHTLPLWYAKKGGFEKSENNSKFVEFAVYVFNRFKKAGLLEQTKVWFAFNETIGFAMAAYVDGKLPPGRHFCFEMAGKVAKNMLDIHIDIYDQFKEIDDSIKVGFIHVMMPMQPYNPHNALHQLMAQTFNYLVNDVALEYFKTGKFRWLYRKNGVFTWQTVEEYNPKAVNKIDFIGVNYYTHTLLSCTGVSIRPDQVCADGYPNKKRTKPIYAEGLYQTLKHADSYGFPLVITEIGFAAQLESVDLRTEYFKKHFYAMHKAMQEGVDLRGCFLWTAFDCFGWNSGQHSTHGIYYVNPETQERTLKDNAHYIVEMFNKAPSEDSIKPLDALVKKTF